MGTVFKSQNSHIEILRGNINKKLPFYQLHGAINRLSRVYQMNGAINRTKPKFKYGLQMQ